MIHGNKLRKFGRETDQRRALLRSLAINLINNGKIVTTEARAKELRPFVEKIITRGKADTLGSKKLLISKLNDKKAAGEVVRNISKKYKEKMGGYTRIVKAGKRKGDGSKMALIEFV